MPKFLTLVGLFRSVGVDGAAQHKVSERSGTQQNGQAGRRPIGARDALKAARPRIGRLRRRHVSRAPSCAPLWRASAEQLGSAHPAVGGDLAVGLLDAAETAHEVPSAASDELVLCEQVHAAHLALRIVLAVLLVDLRLTTWYCDWPVGRLAACPADGSGRGGSAGPPARVRRRSTGRGCCTRHDAASQERTHHGEALSRVDSSLMPVSGNKTYPSR